jgi:hypothetical protein
MRGGILMRQAKDYSISLDDMPENPNFGHPGGSITMNRMPAAGDRITISRRIQLDRVVAYQPSLAITQSALNMDLNFVMETLKDFHGRIAELSNVENLPEFLVEVGTLQEQITELGDLRDFAKLSDIPDIAPISENLTGINGQLAMLAEQVGVMDIVAETNIVTGQAMPNPWFRRYKSGWVEQGGAITSGGDNQGIAVILPVRMSDGNYWKNKVLRQASSMASNNVFIADKGAGQPADTVTTAYFSNQGGNGFYWEVKGMAA